MSRKVREIVIQIVERIQTYRVAHDHQNLRHHHHRGMSNSVEIVTDRVHPPAATRHLDAGTDRYRKKGIEMEITVVTAGDIEVKINIYLGFIFKYCNKIKQTLFRLID